MYPKLSFRNRDPIVFLKLSSKTKAHCSYTGDLGHTVFLKVGFRNHSVPKVGF
jgi:hypothetical protein